jgi:hypothetical protein
MEGVIASLIILGVLLFIMEAHTISTPQTERSMDIKLYQRASDSLACLDWDTTNSWSTMGPLKSYIAGWDGTDASSGNEVPASMAELNNSLSQIIPGHIKYNVNVLYYNETGKHEGCLVYHGKPSDNSVVADRLVTLNSDDAVSDFWKDREFPMAVRVRLTCWYV